MNAVLSDADPQETQEWLEALHSVVERAGNERAKFLVERLIGEVRKSGARPTFSATRLTSTRFRLRAKSARPAMRGWSTEYAPWCAGMRWRWSRVQTANHRV
jgi:pyruvate dehydrogenase complex dehydrogenase (E1) component